MLKKDHVLTKVMACNSRNGRITSGQVSYGVWTNGQVTEEVNLNLFGEKTNSCKVLDVSEGDSIKKIAINYSSSGVNQLSLVTQTGDFKVTGSEGVGDKTKEFNFNNAPYSFFGFIDFQGLSTTITRKS